VFADEIHDASAPIALLNVAERERRDFGTPQPAAQKNGNYGALTHAAQRRNLGSVQKRLSLSCRQPVTCSDAA
jgi:hypothetical protein